MVRAKKPASGEPAEESPTGSIPRSADDAIVDLRVAICDGLLDYLNRRVHVFAEPGLLAEDLSDGLLISVLNLIAPGDAAMEIVSDLILQNRAAPEVAAEALRCLGQVQSEATHEARRRLLERSLSSASHVTRDGAVAGLSSLRDPGAIPALEAAAAREDYRLLRANMFEVLERLKVSPT
jgi:hypothetical protein